MITTKDIKILYVEDHEMVREGIKMALAYQGRFNAIIDDASHGPEAIAKALSASYDIILMDVNIPIKDGIEVTKHLFSKGQEPKILALSMHEEDYIVKKMINAGALGFINKNAGVEELTKAILTVAEGKPYYSNEVAQILLQNKTTNQPTNDTMQTPISFLIQKGLTRREVQILELLSQKHSNNEIAEKLEISKRTVSNHRYKIMQKLNIHSLAGIVAYAHENGLV